MLAAEEACKASIENYLEEPPPARPVSTYLHSFNFGDSVLADLWFVPDGGKSEFVLHLEDEAAEHSLLIYCATKDPKVLVRKFELHWIRRYRAPRILCVDPDRVLDCVEIYRRCARWNIRLYVHPPGAHWSAGRMETRQRLLRRTCRRQKRLRPDISNQELAVACEVVLGDYPGKEGTCSFF